MASSAIQKFHQMISYILSDGSNQFNESSVVRVLPMSNDIVLTFTSLLSDENIASHGAKESCNFLSFFLSCSASVQSSVIFKTRYDLVKTIILNINRNLQLQQANSNLNTTQSIKLTCKFKPFLQLLSLIAHPSFLSNENSVFTQLKFADQVINKMLTSAFYPLVLSPQSSASSILNFMHMLLIDIPLPANPLKVRDVCLHESLSIPAGVSFLASRIHILTPTELEQYFELFLVIIQSTLQRWTGSLPSPFKCSIRGALFTLKQQFPLFIKQIEKLLSQRFSVASTAQISNISNRGLANNSTNSGGAISSDSSQQRGFIHQHIMSPSAVFPSMWSAAIAGDSASSSMGAFDMPFAPASDSLAVVVDFVTTVCMLEGQRDDPDLPDAVVKYNNDSNHAGNRQLETNRKSWTNTFVHAATQAMEESTFDSSQGEQGHDMEKFAKDMDREGVAIGGLVLAVSHLKRNDHSMAAWLLVIARLFEHIEWIDVKRACTVMQFALRVSVCFAPFAQHDPTSHESVFDDNLSPPTSACELHCWASACLSFIMRVTHLSYLRTRGTVEVTTPENLTANDCGRDSNRKLWHDSNPWSSSFLFYRVGGETAANSSGNHAAESPSNLGQRHIFDETMGWTPRLASHVLNNTYTLGFASPLRPSTNSASFSLFPEFASDILPIAELARNIGITLVRCIVSESPTLRTFASTTAVSNFTFQGSLLHIGLQLLSTSLPLVTNTLTKEHFDAILTLCSAVASPRFAEKRKRRELPLSTPLVLCVDIISILLTYYPTFVSHAQSYRILQTISTISIHPEGFSAASLIPIVHSMLANLTDAAISVLNDKEKDDSHRTAPGDNFRYAFPPPTTPAYANARIIMDKSNYHFMLANLHGRLVPSQVCSAISLNALSPPTPRSLPASPVANPLLCQRAVSLGSLASSIYPSSAVSLFTCYTAHQKLMPFSFLPSTSVEPLILASSLQLDSVSASLIPRQTQLQIVNDLGQVSANLLQHFLLANGSSTCRMFPNDSTTLLFNDVKSGRNGSPFAWPKLGHQFYQHAEIFLRQFALTCRSVSLQRLLLDMTAPLPENFASSTVSHTDESVSQELTIVESKFDGDVKRHTAKPACFSISCTAWLCLHLLILSLAEVADNRRTSACFPPDCATFPPPVSLWMSLADMLRTANCPRFPTGSVCLCDSSKDLPSKIVSHSTSSNSQDAQKCHFSLFLLSPSVKILSGGTELSSRSALPFALLGDFWLRERILKIVRTPIRAMSSHVRSVVDISIAPVITRSSSDVISPRHARHPFVMSPDKKSRLKINKAKNTEDDFFVDDDDSLEPEDDDADATVARPMLNKAYLEFDIANASVDTRSMLDFPDKEGKLKIGSSTTHTSPTSSLLVLHMPLHLAVRTATQILMETPTAVSSTWKSWDNERERYDEEEPSDDENLNEVNTCLDRQNLKQMNSRKRLSAIAASACSKYVHDIHLTEFEDCILEAMLLKDPETSMNKIKIEIPTTTTSQQVLARICDAVSLAILHSPVVIETHTSHCPSRLAVRLLRTILDTSAVLLAGSQYTCHGEVPSLLAASICRVSDWIARATHRTTGLLPRVAFSILHNLWKDARTESTSEPLLATCFRELMVGRMRHRIVHTLHASIWRAASQLLEVLYVPSSTAVSSCTSSPRNGLSDIPRERRKASDIMLMLISGEGDDEVKSSAIALGVKSEFDDFGIFDILSASANNPLRLSLAYGCLPAMILSIPATAIFEMMKPLQSDFDEILDRVKKRKDLILSSCKIIAHEEQVDALSHAFAMIPTSKELMDLSIITFLRTCMPNGIAPLLAEMLVGPCFHTIATLYSSPPETKSDKLSKAYFMSPQYHPIVSGLLTCLNACLGLQSLVHSAILSPSTLFSAVNNWIKSPCGKQNHAALLDKFPLLPLFLPGTTTVSKFFRLHFSLVLASATISPQAPKVNQIFANLTHTTNIEHSSRTIEVAAPSLFAVLLAVSDVQPSSKQYLLTLLDKPKFKDCCVDSIHSSISLLIQTLFYKSICNLRKFDANTSDKYFFDAKEVFKHDLLSGFTEFSNITSHIHSLRRTSTVEEITKEYLSSIMQFITWTIRDPNRNIENLRTVEIIAFLDVLFEQFIIPAAASPKGGDETLHEAVSMSFDILSYLSSINSSSSAEHSIDNDVVVKWMDSVKKWSHAVLAITRKRYQPFVALASSSSRPNPLELPDLPRPITSPVFLIEYRLRHMSRMLVRRLSLYHSDLLSHPVASRDLDGCMMNYLSSLSIPVPENVFSLSPSDKYFKQVLENDPIWVLMRCDAIMLQRSISAIPGNSEGWLPTLLAACPVLLAALGGCILLHNCEPSPLAILCSILLHEVARGSSCQWTQISQVLIHVDENDGNETAGEEETPSRSPEFAVAKRPRFHKVVETLTRHPDDFFDDLLSKTYDLLLDLHYIQELEDIAPALAHLTLQYERLEISKVRDQQRSNREDTNRSHAQQLYKLRKTTFLILTHCLPKCTSSFSRKDDEKYRHELATCTQNCVAFLQRISITVGGIEITLRELSGEDFHSFLYKSSPLSKTFQTVCAISQFSKFQPRHIGAVVIPATAYIMHYLPEYAYNPCLSPYQRRVAVACLAAFENSSVASYLTQALSSLPEESYLSRIMQTKSWRGVANVENVTETFRLQRRMKLAIPLSPKDSPITANERSLWRPSLLSASSAANSCGKTAFARWCCDLASFLFAHLSNGASGSVDKGSTHINMDEDVFDAVKHEDRTYIFEILTALADFTPHLAPELLSIAVLEFATRGEPQMADLIARRLCQETLKSVLTLTSIKSEKVNNHIHDLTFNLCISILHLVRHIGTSLIQKSFSLRIANVISSSTGCNGVSSVSSDRFLTPKTSLTRRNSSDTTANPQGSIASRLVETSLVAFWSALDFELLVEACRHVGAAGDAALFAEELLARKSESFKHSSSAGVLVLPPYQLWSEERRRAGKFDLLSSSQTIKISPVPRSNSLGITTDWIANVKPLLDGGVSVPPLVTAVVHAETTANVVFSSDAEFDALTPWPSHLLHSFTTCRGSNSDESLALQALEELKLGESRTASKLLLEDGNPYQDATGTSNQALHEIRWRLCQWKEKESTKSSFTSSQGLHSSFVRILQLSSNGSISNKDDELTDAVAHARACIVASPLDSSLNSTSLYPSKNTKVFIQSLVNSSLLQIASNSALLHAGRDRNKILATSPIESRTFLDDLSVIAAVPNVFSSVVEPVTAMMRTVRQVNNHAMFAANQDNATHESTIKDSLSTLQDDAVSSLQIAKILRIGGFASKADETISSIACTLSDVASLRGSHLSDDDHEFLSKFQLALLHESALTAESANQTDRAVSFALRTAETALKILELDDSSPTLSLHDGGFLKRQSSQASFTSTVTFANGRRGHRIAPENSSHPLRILESCASLLLRSKSHLATFTNLRSSIFDPMARLCENYKIGEPLGTLALTIDEFRKASIQSMKSDEILFQKLLANRHRKELAQLIASKEAAKGRGDDKQAKIIEADISRMMMMNNMNSGTDVYSEQVIRDLHAQSMSLLVNAMALKARNSDMYMARLLCLLFELPPGLLEAQVPSFSNDCARQHDQASSASFSARNSLAELIMTRTPPEVAVQFAYQLSARLSVSGTSSNDMTAKLLDAWASRLTACYPLQMLPPLLSLSAPEDDPSSSANTTANARRRCCEQVIARSACSSPYVSKLMSGMRCASEIFISLAKVSTSKPGDQNANPPSESTFSLKKLLGANAETLLSSIDLNIMPLPACAQPLIDFSRLPRTSLDFQSGVPEGLGIKNIILLSKIEDSVGVAASGITRPKFVRCLNSNGMICQMVVKQDDLRQDFVVQQLFSSLNRHFNSDTGCRMRNIKIRTYKVSTFSMNVSYLRFFIVIFSSECVNLFKIQRHWEI